MIVYDSTLFELYFWIGVGHWVFMITVMTFMDGLDEHSGGISPIDMLVILFGWPILWWKALHK